MCEHLRMDPQDDPEARIRDLERSLAERAKELGTGADEGHAPPAPPPPPPTQPWTQTFGTAYPPPPPGPPAPWPGYAEDFPAPPRQHVPVAHTGRILMILVAVAVFLITTGIAAFLMFTNTVTSSLQPVADNPAGRPALPYSPPSNPVFPAIETPSVAGPGEVINVAGASNDREVTCDGGTVMVSGVENTITITGHCAAVTISGIRNVIEVDEADTIGVSGFENRVTYSSGEPEITKSGMDNTVERRAP
ncbi:hypothetical protein LI99_26285 [Mycolicibacterium smegmatis]|uniref:DUF3060 domain-containing protein n=4 Tax=Mycolicibacterium smegmatis TaxID=1772 RepID=A0R324_MYCS2|nr:conserved hypothetical protein [Mycolicibacterium smegmatis MC2 155]AIU16970.1 hypothetical protein LI99_26285 [Mycolicibacterium smegmatis]AWT56153.1 hypothetical protein D806_052030 [Mycolicibacterium smegmatis MKD8]AFP41617.1 Conserved membrane protein [Mycolicibacterium smegmatis MC2 155]AIU10345.1 hypothetical protein LJ00_26280 [Mycolicibacterium smegmatis MC2 155]